MSPHEHTQLLKSGGLPYQTPARPFTVQVLNDKEFRISRLKIENPEYKSTIAQ